MARLLTPEELDARDRRRADDGRDAAMSAIPRRLRPSSWSEWLETTSHVPDLTRKDEVEAAYGVTVEQLSDGAAVGQPSDHWRQIVADQRHHDAYLAWLTERGLTYTAGATGVVHPMPGYQFGDVERWEAAR